MPEIGISAEDLKHILENIAECLESVETKQLNNRELKQDYILAVQTLLTEADNELCKIENMVKGVDRSIIVVEGASTRPESVTDSGVPRRGPGGACAPPR